MIVYPRRQNSSFIAVLRLGAFEMKLKLFLKQLENVKNV
jgi:hypothetical protein